MLNRPADPESPIYPESTIYSESIVRWDFLLGTAASTDAVGHGLHIVRDFCTEDFEALDLALLAIHFFVKLFDRVFEVRDLDLKFSDAGVVGRVCSAQA